MRSKRSGLAEAVLRLDALTRKHRVLDPFSAVLLIFFVALPVVAEPDQRLLLRSGSFDPLAVRQPVGSDKEPRGDFGIVQFVSRAAVDPDLLEALGASVRAYLPQHAFLVRLNGRAPAYFGAHPEIRFAGLFRPEYKSLGRLARRWEKTADEVRLTVVGFPGEPPAALRAAISAGGGGIFAGPLSGRSAAYRVRVPGPAARAAVEALTLSTAVMWIEPYLEPRPMNADSIGVIQGNADSGGLPPTFTPIWDQGLIGSGQIVAVADSGLDRNEDWFDSHDSGFGVNAEITDAELVLPPALGTLYPARKVVGYWVSPGASPYDDNQLCPTGEALSSFHGTHTTGTVAGDSGVESTPSAPNYDRGDGMAPNAQILFQDIGDDTTGCLSGLQSASRYALFQQAFDAGAAIASNSFGAAPPRDDNDQFDPDLNFYAFSDFSTDEALYELEDLVVIVSAGNAGVADSIGHHANAKHTIAVAALNHGNDPTVAEFSSRGPANDGRLKPDLGAPGVGIVSASGNDNDANPPGPFAVPATGAKQGTSMSAPTVAGGMALLRQYFTAGFYPTGAPVAANAHLPSGPLLKAVMLNGTRTYADTPATDSGWGRIWLDNSLYFAGDARGLRTWNLSNADGLESGEQREFTVRMELAGDLRATLVWYDPPGFSASAIALVNDLDLEVDGPGGRWLGNVFAAGESVGGGSPDRLNPVEQVLLRDAPPGDYTIRVRADFVPGSGPAGTRRQGFALAASAPRCAAAIGASPAIELLADATGVTVAYTPVAGAEVYQVYRAEGSCASANRYRFIGHTPDLAFEDPDVNAGIEYAYRVRGADGCGEGPASACKSVFVQNGLGDGVSGPWFNASQSGHGWLIELLPGVTPADPDRVNAYWYVYSNGLPVWLIGTGDVSGTSATLDVVMTAGADFPPAFDAGDVELIPWGTLRFDFDGASGTANWNSLLPEFGSGALDMVQLAPISARAASCRSGSYFNATQSGHGFVVEVVDVGGADQVILAWYVYLNGEQVWLFGQGPLTGDSAEVPVSAFSGAGFPPDFDPAEVTSTPWGTVSITFTGPDSARIDWTTNLAGYSDGGLDVTRLTELKGHACP